MNEALVFDIAGRMAHFRRFYSSVTPLTYYFPPRNTIMGMIASILGLERDSYYSILAKDNIGIALSILTKPRKLILPTNYLDTDAINEDRLRGGSKKPTNIEYILPMDNNELIYRVYLVVLNDIIKERINELADMLKDRRTVYPLSLGPANCLAEPRYVAYTHARLLKYEEYKDNYIPISTVIQKEIVIEKGIKFEEGKKIFLEERLPPDFGENRTINNESRNYIFEWEGKPIDIKLMENKITFSINIDGRALYGLFL